MRYGALVARAWILTWRHRFLWVLGLFAFGTAGSCSPAGHGGTMLQWQARAADLGRAYPEVRRVLRMAGLWVFDNPAAMPLGLAAILILGVLLLAVSLVAQGGMARAAADLALGLPESPGGAWSAGLRLARRYLALWLLLILLAALVGLAVSTALGQPFRGTGFLGDPPGPALPARPGFLPPLIALAALSAAFALSVVVTFAQRAIAVEEVGPLAALGVALRLLRDHLRAATLLWLLSLVLTVAGGLAVAAGVVALLVPLALLALVVYTILDLSAALAIYLVASLLALAAAGCLLAGLANSFLWNFWTLAYLRFTGHLTDRFEVPRGQ